MSIGDWLKEQKDKTTAEIKQFSNKDFMEATAASCAMISCADGSISSEEKQKMAGYINLNDSLKVFDLNDVLTRFNHYVDMYEFDYNVGKTEAMKAIGKIKRKSEEAKALVALCCSIGATEGDFDKAEIALVKEICSVLKIKAADFKL